jgi:formate dehydrogenase subunit gamma
MSSADQSAHLDPAVIVAREREDVAVGDVIVRHRRSVRIAHWSVVLFFLVCLGSGMPIWSPVFGWMAGFFGGLETCRWLHPWSGAAFVLGTWILFGQWQRSMRFEAVDRPWFGPRALSLATAPTDESVGKFNGGQKILFWLSILMALVMAASGVVMWWPEEFPSVVRQASILFHDATFIVFVCAIVVHAYLGTAAEPGTFRSMTRGTVTREWARTHHPRWYREVTGGDAKKR